MTRRLGIAVSALVSALAASSCGAGGGARDAAEVPAEDAAGAEADGEGGDGGSAADGVDGEAGPDAFGEDDAAADGGSDADRDAVAATGLSLRGRWLGMTGGDGRWRAAIPTGQLSASPEDVLDRMAAAGKNVIQVPVGAGGYGCESLSLYAGHDFRRGFDEGAWGALAAFLAAAFERSVGVILALWGTVALEGECGAEPARWEVNPWNASGVCAAGGPYALPGCGKHAFYSFERPGEFVYAPGSAYPEGASASVRGQWRQEEIVHRLAALCRSYPNAAVQLMWEADDYGSHLCGECDTDEATVAAWHAHHAGLIRSVSPSTLVATGTDWGTWYPALDFLTAQVGPVEVGRYCAARLQDHAVVSTGWAVEAIEACCDAGCGPEEYAAVPANVRRGWLCGLQVGAPFWEYREGTCYPAAHVDPYLSALRGFLDGVVTWEDEPGGEIAEATLPVP